MTHRALLFAALIFSLGAASAAPSAFGPANAASLSVRAGVGGAARPGRWMPVDIAVSAGESPFKGSVIVEWGGSTARRDVDLAAASTVRITLLLRTIAATPDVRVALADAAGAPAATSVASVLLLPVDDPAALCIGDVPAATACAIRVPETEAPLSWRGFDLADEVVWPSGGGSRPEAAKAFALWQAARWWQNSGFVDPVVAPFDNNSHLADRTSVSLGLFVLVLFFAAGAAAWRRAPAIALTALPLAATVAGVALVTSSSRAVDIEAATFVHQFAGVAQPIVLTKGDVEHPSGRLLELTPEIAEASLDLVRGLQQFDGTSTTDGRATYRHTAGRGVRQRFEMNGTAAEEMLFVGHRDGRLSVENRSAFPLSECQLRGADVIELGAMGISAATEAAVAAIAPGDAVVCRLPADWIKWSAGGAIVTTRGNAFLIFHFWPGAAGPGASDAAR